LFIVSVSAGGISAEIVLGHVKVPEMRAYIDSDILIWHLRGESRALKFFKKMRKENRYELWTGSMQRAEIAVFMRPKERESTLLFLSQFKVSPVDQNIVDKAANIYQIHHPVLGMDVNDGLLAATVIHYGGVLYTLNVKHYPKEGIVVNQAW
jgi:predicted nucleic acid-binding protein